MVDALVSVAAENLLKMATDEAMLLVGVRTGLDDLSSELRTIRAVLQDAEMKQIKDEAVRIWLQKLKYVAYEIEDMVEAWDQKMLKKFYPEDAKKVSHGGRTAYISCNTFEDVEANISPSISRLASK